MAITMNEIAKLCGVSRGTVDRALHNKGNVRAEVAERIKQVAKEHGYQPNRAGLALSYAHRPIKVGVISHSMRTTFMPLIMQHIERKAIELSSFSTNVLIRSAPDLDPLHQLALIDELVNDEKVDGLIISPVHSSIVSAKLNKLIDGGLPIITYNTDVPDCRRLCYVGQDNITAGHAAGQLMGLSLGGKGKILPLTGFFEGHYAYTQRLQGFTDEIREKYPNIELLPPESMLESPTRCEQLTAMALAYHPDITGIYIVSYGYRTVCETLKRLGVEKDIFVIAHDEVAENLQSVRENVLNAIIGQDAYIQGTLPLQLMSDYLLLKKPPKRVNYFTDIRIMLEHNLETLDLYLD